MPRLYRGLASWWPLLSAPEDYAEAAAFYRRVIEQSCARKPTTLLELGSGGGNNASHLKARFRMTLVDRSPGMLDVSRTLNPECEHRRGDMRTVRLGRLFDAVFIQDAIAYLTTHCDLRRALATAYLHCRPGGAALFAPDFVRETYRPSTQHGGHDGPSRGLRYLEWTSPPERRGGTYRTDFAFLLREADGSVRVERDSHRLGLFRRIDWLRLIREVGFHPRRVRFHAADPGGEGGEVFVGVKPLKPVGARHNRLGRR